MKLPIASYSLLKAFDNCPRQTFHRYIKKDLPYEETEQIRWGNEVHAAMEAFIRSETPLPGGMVPYMEFVRPAVPGRAEWKAGIDQSAAACEFDNPRVFFRGKLDCTLVDETKTAAVILDWKTGKTREDPDELECYAVLLKAHYPHLKKITGWYVWLKEKHIGRIYDLSRTEEKLKEIRNRYARFEQAFRTDFWPPRQSGLCGWCGVTSCEFNPKRKK